MPNVRKTAAERCCGYAKAVLTNNAHSSNYIFYSALQIN